MGLHGHDQFIGDRRIEPVDLVHLAHHDELVAVGADGSVVVEAVAELRVAADHVRGLEHDAGHRVVDAAAHAGDLGPRRVHDLFLSVVHHHHARIDALTDHRPGRDRAVQVEQFDPVVVLDAHLLRVVFAHPDARATATEREHQQVVGVGAVDAPLLVRGDEVQRDLGVAVRPESLDAGGGLQVDRRTVAGEPFTERDHPRVIHVELLAAGQRAPRDHLVHVGVAGVVRDGLALDAAPGRRADDLARLRLHVAEADLLVLAVDRQVRVIEAGLLAERFPGLDRHMAVGLWRELQDHLARIDVGLDLRHAAGHAFGGDQTTQLTELLHLGLRVPGDALAAVAGLVHQRAECGEPLEDVRIVALDDLDVGRSLSGHQIAFATLPVLDLERLRQFGRAVMHQRGQHQFALDTEVTDTDLAELLRESLVDVPVAARLPRRIDRRRQWVDERVHVAGVEIVLLVPGGGGQHDVAVQARGAHAEVERDQQIQLALGRLVVPDDFGGLGFFHAQVLALHAVAGAEQVLQEILVALAGRSQDVGAPHEHVARPVVRVVRIGAAQLERAVLEALDCVVLRLHACGSGILHHLHRIRLQLRRGRQPAHALGAHVVVDHAAGIQLLVSQRRQHLVHAELLVAPLVGVRIEEAGAVHLARRADPVEREGQRRPAGLWPQLLLTHVVRPAATALPDAAAHHQHVDDAAVVHVAVIPVVHRGADDHHRLAVRLVRVLGELAGHRDQLRAWRAGDAFLPGRRVRRVLVEIGRGELTRQAARDAVVGHLQVEHSGNQRAAFLAGLAQRDALDRHGAHDHVAAVALQHAVREVGALDAAEVREADTRRRAARLVALEQRQLELHGLAVTRFLRLEVPLAFVGPSVGTPAEADRAVGQHHLATLVEGDGLPFGVVSLAELAVEVGRPHIAIGHHDDLAAGQRVLLEHHQHRHVGVAAHVVVEIGAALTPVREIELLQDHVAHRHRDGRIGALLRAHPDVGQLGDLGIVGRHRDRLRTLVANLGEEVRIGRARLRHVRAPGDDETAVVPIGRFGHVGLLAPDLRAGRRQVAVPVVEAHADAADQAQVARAGGIADHAHRRDRREADHAIGTMLLDRVDVGRGDDLVDLVPGRAHEAAETAHLLVVAALRIVLDDAGPCIDRIVHQTRLAP